MVVDKPTDLLIHAGHALPLVGASVLTDAVIAVDNGTISYLGTAASAPRFAPSRTIHEPTGLVIPGLVNTHTHLAAHLWSTLCEDENIITALYEVWFPMEQYLTDEIVHCGGLLGLWDAVRSGVTTVANDEYFPDATARAVDKIGCRALIANRINEFPDARPPRYHRDRQEYELTFDRAKATNALDHNLELIDKWRNHGRVFPCLGPHAPDLLSTEMLRECSEAARLHDVKMLMHVAQSRAELAEVRRRGYKGSIAYLDDLGMVGPRLQGAHMVWLDDAEIDTAAASGMGMSWTPTIMMACESFAQIDRLLASGINIGFGTDCFGMDILEELRYALYAANYVRFEEPDSRLRAADVVRMATIGGARCLGLESVVGTIEVGKAADLAILNLSDPCFIPMTNAIEAIAYRARGRHVLYTIVGGDVIYEDGRLTHVDADRVLADAAAAGQEWIERSREILEGAGVAPRLRGSGSAWFP
jgi:5-methylthioadenosine/S-adenosylhomocysteine deaminase